LAKQAFYGEESRAGVAGGLGKSAAAFLKIIGGIKKSAM
jgi:hypothetical protein